MMKCLSLLLLAPLLASGLSPVQPPNVKKATITRNTFWKESLAVAVGSMAVVATPAPVAAKPKDISGQDFSGQDFSGKDFTGMIAKGTKFQNCNLKGSLFTNANLESADFSNADVRGANFVDAKLDGSSFKNAQAQRAVFGASILDVGNLENVDLTQSLWPSKLRIMICDMDELKGQNPVTGVDSQDSIKCTDIMYKS